MSELKARHVFDVYEDYTKTGDDDAAQVYLKSEADEVISTIKAERDEYRYNLSCARNEIHNMQVSVREDVKRIADKDKVIADLKEKHKKEVEMLSTYCREQTEKLCIEMTVVDSLEQNLKKLNRTIWLCRAWAARNLALYYKLWCERYKDNSNESLASCYLNDSKKWESFYHKFKALADKFKEEA